MLLVESGWDTVAFAQPMCSREIGGDWRHDKGREERNIDLSSKLHWANADDAAGVVSLVAVDRAASARSAGARRICLTKAFEALRNSAETFAEAR